MAQDKKLVEQITSMDEDFAKWYTDVCTKADLVGYTSVMQQTDDASPDILLPQILLF